LADLLSSLTGFFAAGAATGVTDFVVLAGADFDATTGLAEAFAAGFTADLGLGLADAFTEALIGAFVAGRAADFATTGFPAALPAGLPTFAVAIFLAGTDFGTDFLAATGVLVFVFFVALVTLAALAAGADLRATGLAATLVLLLLGDSFGMAILTLELGRPINERSGHRGHQLIH
jgi:hypothetical protein